MLNGLRALDLTDEKGFLCGKILADLGVEVIKIERPCGDPARKIGPFWEDIPDPEKRLYWFAYNSNKKGITLNIETADGRQLFKDLVKTADFVIESFSPGYLEKLGIGYNDLSKDQKGLIWASITPFGQKGPYSNFKDSDLIVMGMSGTMYQTGESDGAPLQMSMPQACMHAGADAAVGAMVAYYYREKTGDGQQVDVSMQQSAGWFQANAIPVWELNKGILIRAWAFRAGMSKAVGQRQVWKCKDGYVFFNVIGGRTGAKSLKARVDWMHSEGKATDFLLNMNWETFDMFTVTRDVMDKISGPVGDFFRSHNGKDLLNGAVPRGVSIGPLSSIQDLLEDKCLNARGFWKQIEHPELGTKITYPKQFISSTENNFATRFRAPLIGEHNQEIYKQMGISDRDLIIYEQAGII